MHPATQRSTGGSRYWHESPAAQTCRFCFPTPTDASAPFRPQVWPRFRSRSGHIVPQYLNSALKAAAWRRAQIQTGATCERAEERKNRPRHAEARLPGRGRAIIAHARWCGLTVRNDSGRQARASASTEKCLYLSRYGSRVPNIRFWRVKRATSD